MGVDIYSVRLGWGGARLGPDVRITTAADILDDFATDLAWNPQSGRYLLIRSKDLQELYGRDVYGQWLSAGGQPLGSGFRIIQPKDTPEQDATDDTSGTLAYDSVNNRYLVAWSDYRLAGTQNLNIDIWGRLVNG